MYLVHIKVVQGVIIALKMFAFQPGMLAYTKISAYGTLREEDYHEFEASLNCK